MAIDASKHWRERAARMRELSEAMDNPLTRDNLRRSAEEYDRMAVEAERREQEVKSRLLS